MTELELVLVTPDYKDQYLEMIAESKEDIINSGFELTIPLSNSITFDTNIKKLTDMHKGIELKEGRVPASSYWLMNKLEHKLLVLR